MRRIVIMVPVVMLVGLLGFGGLGSHSPAAVARESNVGSHGPSAQGGAAGCATKGIYSLAMKGVRCAS